MSLVTTSAVNMDTTIPSARVWANPLTGPLPRNQSTAAAIRVVMFPSRIADMALWKPAFSDACTEVPAESSSFTRAKMMTFASTAIPIPRMIPAIPGRVSVMSNAFRSTSVSPV